MEKPRPSWLRAGRLCAMLLMLFALVPALPTAVHAATPTASVFYPATKAAYDAWNATTSTARPPKTTTFASGTTVITFYFEYDGATAKSTEFTIAIKGRGGSAFTTHGPFTTEHSSGLHMSKVDAPHGTYPDGSYSVDLLLNQRAAAHTTFTVGSGSKASAGILYTATRAAYDAWNASTSNARPPKTTAFPASTTQVAFYFEYSNATPKVTQYQLIVRNHSGAAFASRGPFPVSYKNGLAMRYILAPNGAPYPSGTYKADLLLDGRVAQSATFTVGGQSVGVSILFPATKAAYDTWTASTSTARPSQTTAFPSGTSTVTFYFEYNNARPKVTQYTIVVKNQAGQVVVSHGPYVTSYKNGLQMSPVKAPSGSYANGAYRADLLLDGRVLSSTFFSVGTQTAATLTCQSSDVIATCLEPSILRLHADLPNNMQGEGTGFVIRADATGTYLLTNKHVVEGAVVKNMYALSPDGNTKYKVLAFVENSADAGTAGDLAVVKLEPTSLKPLTWGDSEHLHLLQKVISIGYGDAFDLPGPPTVTEGAISALHRDLSDGYGPVWIQHQSFINHGNSGGPLLDAQYNVVGVNTLSQKQTQGIFFAIPSSLARNVAAKLITQLGG